MSDPGNDNDHNGAGTIWRLKPSKHEGLAVLGGPIVFELTDGLGSTLASVSIPLETIDELLTPHLSIFAELQLDGSVATDSEFFSLFPPENPPDIVDLVKQALAPEMLHDEPNLKDRLQELRRKLTEALGLVDQTIANLGKPDA